MRYTAAGLGMVMFWLLFGEFAIAFRDRSAVPSVTELLRQHHASDTMVAVLVSALPALLSSVLVPIVGFRSDRFRSRWGRRLPFLAVVTPLAALALAALGYCPQLGWATDRLLGAMSPGVDTCVLGWFCVFWTLFEAIALVSLALYGGLVNDILPRRILGRFYAAFRIVSLGAGILFNLWVFHLTEHHLREVFLGIGLFYGAACLLMCVNVREGEYVSGTTGQVPQDAPPLRSIARTYWNECFSVRRYLLAFVALMASELAFVPFNTFSQLYAASMGLDKAMLGSLLATSYALSIGLSPIVGWLVDRYSAASMTWLALACYLGVSLGALPLVHDTHGFSILYVTHVVVSGAYYTACGSLPMALFPRSRFLQFDSAKRFFGSASTILLSLVLGPTLDISGHQYGLTLLYGGLFAGASLVAFWHLNCTATDDIFDAASE
nr:MFS transporter [Massilia sp. JS1662]